MQLLTYLLTYLLLAVYCCCRRWNCTSSQNVVRAGFSGCRYHFIIISHSQRNTRNNHSVTTRSVLAGALRPARLLVPVYCTQYARLYQSSTTRVQAKIEYVFFEKHRIRVWYLRCAQDLLQCCVALIYYVIKLPTASHTLFWQQRQNYMYAL